MASVAPPRTVGILIFPDVEILDFCGPFEVFASATLPPQAEGGAEMRLFDVVTIAEHPDVVTCRGGLLVQPNQTFAEHFPVDVLVVPSGYSTRREQENPVVLDWIARQRSSGALTTSVCTGAFLLAERGLLDGKRATTHWASVEWMTSQYPAVQMLADARVVDEGHIVTSAGVSAGIDMALHIVARLHGEDAAAFTARRMEYDHWNATAGV